MRHFKKRYCVPSLKKGVILSRANEVGPQMHFICSDGLYRVAQLADKSTGLGLHSTSLASSL